MIWLMSYFNELERKVSKNFTTANPLPYSTCGNGNFCRGKEWYA